MLLDYAAGNSVPCPVLTSVAPDQAKSVALGVLANSSWSQVSEAGGREFAAANGIDLFPLDDKTRHYDRQTGSSAMSDDLFEFLTVQEMGRAAEVSEACYRRSPTSRRSAVNHRQDQKS